jgi:CheY-like chemotaxis protein/HPt (histidine-containing phosphotransfer) domain-containing protein
VKRSSKTTNPVLATLPNGRRAIVIEASRRWCRIIREHLTAWGLECDIFQDGKPGLKALEDAAQSYDIAVVGAELRDLPIEEFVTHMRRLPNGKDLPIIALTQLGASATLTEVENELTAQVAKPLRLSELYDCIVGTFAGTGIRAPMPRAEQRAVRNRGKRILVVDDNDINQFVASEQILDAGYEADVANNGAEGVSKIKANNYAAVLMDCQMPVMDGYTATRKIREWEGNQRHVPIIALTAHAMAGERDKVLAAGMDDYLAKPLRAHALERMLERYAGGDTASADSPSGVNSTRGEQNTKKPAELDMTIKRSPRLVELFVSRVPQNLEDLDRSIERADARSVRSHAHKLKGSCLAIGAEIMAKESETLQFEAEKGDLERARDRAATLWSQYDRVIAVLESEMPANDANPSKRVSAE